MVTGLTETVYTDGLLDGAPFVGLPLFAPALVARGVNIWADRDRRALGAARAIASSSVLFDKKM